MTLEQSSPEVKQKEELTLLQKVCQLQQKERVVVVMYIFLKFQITFFFIGILSAFTIYGLIRFSNGLLFESKTHAIPHDFGHLNEDLLRM